MNSHYLFGLETSTGSLYGVAVLDLVTQQTQTLWFEGYPYPSETGLAQWHAWMKTLLLDPAACLGIAVSMGPGSFTGIRLGMLWAQGLALGWQCPVWPIGTLEALAERIPIQAGCSDLILMDARMRQTYGVWRSPEGLFSEVQVQDPDDWVYPDQPYRLVGSALSVYPEAFQGHPQAHIHTQVHPESVARCAFQRWQKGDRGIDPVDLSPNYVRNRVVQ